MLCVEAGSLHCGGLGLRFDSRGQPKTLHQYARLCAEKLIGRNCSPAL